VLLPTECAACGARGPSPCAGCRAQLRPPPALPPPVAVDRLRSLLSYDGAGRELVARLKYRNARASLPWLAAGMAALVDRREVDVVTWVPTTGRRRRSRGFDQGRLLASAVASVLDRPCRATLRRLPGPAQTGRTLSERRTGPRFGARGRPSGRVLLVDDVCTSGATMTAAARALRSAGVARVEGLTTARAPRR